MTKGWTAEKDEPSQFDPNLSDAEIEAMELACVQDERNLIRDRCHKRTYFRKLDRDIGASAGVFTPFIFVEYVNSGLVHGWPISEPLLQRKLGR
jgi:hypothetical protein